VRQRLRRFVSQCHSARITRTVRGTVGSDSFVIDAAPPGTWHLLAYARVPRSRAVACAETDRGSDETITCVGAHGPITIAGDRSEMISVEVSLRPAGASDPPILRAVEHLPDERIRTCHIHQMECSRDLTR
jgi:hypothetical protein